jgi:hypothetical protein
MRILLIAYDFPYLPFIILIYPPGTFPETYLAIGRGPEIPGFIRKRFAREAVKQRWFSPCESNAAKQYTTGAKCGNPYKIPSFHGLCMILWLI